MNVKTFINSLNEEEREEIINHLRSEIEKTDKVRWIISVNGKAYFYYKYSDPSPSISTKYREIMKREFGEVIKKP